jgi:hypothetical protein
MTYQIRTSVYSECADAKTREDDNDRSGGPGGIGTVKGPSEHLENSHDRLQYANHGSLPIPPGTQSAKLRPPAQP